MFFLLAKQSVIGMGMSQQCKCKCKCKSYDYETIFLATHFFFFTTLVVLLWRVDEFRYLGIYVLIIKKI